MGTKEDDDEVNGEIDDRVRITEAIADGFELFRRRDAERRVKEEIDNGDNDGDGSGGDGNGKPKRRRLGDILLGNK